METPERIEMLGHTTSEGTLTLTVNTGLANADVSVVLQVRPIVSPCEYDENGWPVGFFDRIAGSMPDLERAPQGEFEQRLPLE